MTPSLKSLRDFDSYHLEISRGFRQSGDNQLSFATEKVAGGKYIFSITKLSIHWNSTIY